MTYRYYDYRCAKCGFKKESLEKVGTNDIGIDCWVDDETSCKLRRMVSIPKIAKVDPYVPAHTRRARRKGYDATRDKAMEAANKQDEHGWEPKIQSGPGKNVKRGTV